MKIAKSYGAEVIQVLRERAKAKNLRLKHAKKSTYFSILLGTEFKDVLKAIM